MHYNPITRWCLKSITRWRSSSVLIYDPHVLIVRSFYCRSVIMFFLQKNETNIMVYDERIVEYLIHDINPIITIITLEGQLRKLIM